MYTLTYIYMATCRFVVLLLILNILTGLIIYIGLYKYIDLYGYTDRFTHIRSEGWQLDMYICLSI